jgi:hypothetical protein
MIFMHNEDASQALDGLDTAVQPVSRRLLDCDDAQESTQAFLRRRLVAQMTAEALTRREPPFAPALKLSR